jgi:hypothetical protein
MAYFIDLFSPETYEAFKRSSRDISGFRLRHKRMAERITSGDMLICYMTRLSRWVGALEVIDGPSIDSTPIFLPENDPFVVRFRVRPVVWLDVEKAIPIRTERIWNGLSFTKGLEEGSIAWTGKVRGSLVRLDDNDGKLLFDLLQKQSVGGDTYALDDDDTRKLTTHTVNRPDKVVTVSVPDDSNQIDNEEPEPERTTVRESIQIQALIAGIGDRMGLSIWLPRADRGAVLSELKTKPICSIDFHSITTTQPFAQLSRSMFCGCAGALSSELLKSSTPPPYIPAFCGWRICWPYSLTWILDFTSSRQSPSAIKSSLKFADPYFHYLRKARLQTVAHICRTTVCANSPPTNISHTFPIVYWMNMRKRRNNLSTPKVKT